MAELAASRTQAVLALAGALAFAVSRRQPGRAQRCAAPAVVRPGGAEGLSAGKYRKQGKDLQ